MRPEDSQQMPITIKCTDLPWSVFSTFSSHSPKPCDFCKDRLVTDVVRYNPDEFAICVSALCDPELSSRWSRATSRHCISGSSEALINAAFAALTHWSTVSFAGPMSLQMQGIQGAIVTVSRRIIDTQDQCYELTRRFGTLFHSQNIGVAFAAIREFDVHLSSSYSIFVIDHLVRVASEPDVPVSPTEMSLRGIAFKVLWFFTRIRG
jgi:hypothetical protein